MSHTVGEVAKLASVSVRTLHHYDEIGLLSPTRRSEAGYRLYAHGDLGFELGEIRTLLDTGDDIAHLRHQATALDQRIHRLEAMRATRHVAEAEERWGDSDAWAQSRARTASYGKDDWLRIKEEMEAIEARVAAYLRAAIVANADRHGASA